MYNKNTAFLQSVNWSKASKIGDCRFSFFVNWMFLIVS